MIVNDKPQLKRHADKSNADSPLLDAIIKSLEDDKAEEIVIIDLTGKSTIADSMVIASGRSQRHVAAIADHLLRNLKDGGFGRQQIEGLPQADWVLIDAKDTIIHIFRPEVRSYYRLEKMWQADFND